jgi:hypothetical protein
LKFGKGPRSHGPAPSLLVKRAGFQGRPNLDGKALPPQKRESPDERGCLCTLLPRGAKDAQPHRPSSSDGDALPLSLPSPARGGGGGCPPRGRVARGAGEGRSDMGLTGVNHLHGVPPSPPPSARPRPGGRPNGTERREGRRKDSRPLSFLPGDPGGPNRQKT